MHGARPMSMVKLRTWYEKMLARAADLGVVKHFGGIQEELVEHLTSIRDFPMFEGDFFPGAPHLRTPARTPTTVPCHPLRRPGS